MPPSPFSIERFGGLNLHDSVDSVGAERAVAITDLDVDVPGQLRTRPGREYLSGSNADASTFSDTPLCVVENAWTSAQAHQAMVSPTKLAVYDASGFNTAAVTASTLGLVDLMPGPTGTLTWVLDGTGLRQWDNSTHTLAAAAAGTPKGGYIAMQLPDARIVIAGATTAGAGQVRVNFSDPGTSTFGANNWIDLAPGVENITGVATCGNNTVVFKETKAFAFYGNGVDQGGEPLFNYHSIDLGDHIRYYNAATSAYSSPGRFGVDQSAIYYVAARGVYALPRGGEAPQLISGALSAVFRDEVAAIGTGLGTNPTAFVCATSDRLYVGAAGFPSTLVMDKATGQWTVYGYTSNAMAPGPGLRLTYAQRTGYVVTNDTHPRLARLSEDVATDLGATITWSYQSGKYSMADPGLVVVAPYSKVVGKGTVTLRLDTEAYTAISASATLGSSTTAEGWPSPIDNEGAQWQYTLSGSGAVTIDRLVHYVSFVKPAGVS